MTLRYSSRRYIVGGVIASFLIIVLEVSLGFLSVCVGFGLLPVCEASKLFKIIAHFL
jgi:hypothetical protein